MNERIDTNDSFRDAIHHPRMRLMSNKRRNERSRNRGYPAALALVLVVFGSAMPLPAAGCGMGMGRAPSASVAAPDCCTDRSCPSMAVAPSQTEGMISTPPAFAPTLSVAGMGEFPAATFSPLLVPPPRIFRDSLLGPPLRI
jgi:hypothetical protein